MRLVNSGKLILVACGTLLLTQAHAVLRETDTTQTVARDAYLQCEKALNQKAYKAAQKACQTGIQAVKDKNTVAANQLYDLQTHVLMLRRDYKAAEQYSQKSLAMAREREGSGSVAYAQALITQGQLSLAEGDFKEAEKAFTIAEQRLRRYVFETQLTAKDKLYHWATYGLVTAYAGQGNEMAAERVLRTSFMANGYEKPSNYAIKMGLVTGYGLAGEAMYQLKQMERAQVLFEEAIRVYNDYSYQGTITRDQNGQVIIAKPEGITATYYHLSKIYEKQGKKKEAAELREEAIKWASVGSP